MGRPVICRLCGARIENEEPVIIKITGSLFYRKKCHAACYEKLLKGEEIVFQENAATSKKKDTISSKKKTENKMTKEEIAERDELANYIKELFGFHVLTRAQMHKINSLRMGDIVRKNDKIKGGCPYSVILLTFKAKKIEIDYALKTKHFDSENGKFNYVMAIITNNINEVYARWKDSQEQKKQLDKMHELEINSCEEEKPKGHEYVPKKNKYLNNPLFEDLWE